MYKSLNSLKKNGGMRLWITKWTFNVVYDVLDQDSAKTTAVKFYHHCI